MEDNKIFIVSEDLANAAYRKAQEYADTYKEWRWGQCIFNAYYTFSQKKATSCVVLMMTAFIKIAM